VDGSVGDGVEGVMLFDTMHLDDERFEGALDGVLDRSSKPRALVPASAGYASSRRAIALSEKRD
jgi:hypothetical protein